MEWAAFRPTRFDRAVADWVFALHTPQRPPNLAAGSAIYFGEELNATRSILSASRAVRVASSFSISACPSDSPPIRSAVELRPRANVSRSFRALSDPHSRLAQDRTHRASARQDRAIHFVRGPLRKSRGLLSRRLHPLFCFLRARHFGADSHSPLGSRCKISRFRRASDRPPLAARCCLRSFAVCDLRPLGFACAHVLALSVPPL